MTATIQQQASACYVQQLHHQVRSFVVALCGLSLPSRTGWRIIFQWVLIIYVHAYSKRMHVVWCSCSNPGGEQRKPKRRHIGAQFADVSLLKVAIGGTVP